MALTRHLLALALYLAAAIAGTWPLARHLSTHLLGDPSGDTGVYVWNLWVFARGWATAAGPLVTDALFALTGSVDLVLHNYTVASDLAALPLVGRLGPVAAFNLVLVFQLVLAAWGAFVLARHVTGDTRAAWIAGFAFALSPVLSAKSAGHQSLVAAAPLPLFCFAVLRALESRRWPWWAAVAGLCAGWAGYSDAYYPIYCALLLGAILAHRAIRLAPVATTSPRLPWLGYVAATAAALGLVIGVTGGVSFSIGGHLVHARTPYTAMMFAAVCVQVLLVWRLWPRLRLADGFGLRRAAGIAVVTGAGAVAALSPLLAALARRAAEGRWSSTPIPWRSSPPGLDALALLLPNPSHPWFAEFSQSRLWAWRPDAFPEHVGSLSLIALAVVCAMRVANRRWWDGAHLWAGIAAGSVLLAIGPFLTVGGFNTAFPGPWSLLRFAPVIGLARSPSRFAVLATLALCVLLAFAVRDLSARRRGPWLVVAISLLLAVELVPAPRVLHAARAPSIYEVIAADPDPRVRVLELPAGLRDGTRSLGNFRTRTQYYQTVHGKPLIGGYLSRISDLRRRRTLEIPTMRALLRLSEGQPLAPEDDAQARFLARQFVQRARIGYVVLIEDRVSPELRQWAIEALELRLIAESGGRELYVPAAWPPETPARERPFRKIGKPAPEGDTSPNDSR